MRLFSVRRGAAASALSVAAVAALVAPGVASAKKEPAKCSGGPIVAAGSTLQKLAQKEAWDPKFTSATEKNSAACPGGSDTVSYESIGSGKGLEDWGYKGHAFEAGRVAIVTTDEPVNAEEKAEIEAKETTSTKETVLSIPVLQSSVAILVHLPENCEATSTYSGAEGRLVLSNEALQKIWDGEISKWSQITESGDKVFGTGCNPNAEFTRYVRLDQSGTTHILKKYLGLINDNPLKTVDGEFTWARLSESDLNQTWPESTKAVPAKEEGGGALVKEIANNANSIGYASLADARSNGGFSKTGGPHTSKFWVEIQNNGVGVKGAKYADPSTDGDTEALAKSNCVKTKYTNGKGTKFPPESVKDTWNEVTSATKEKNYSLCGITYDTTLSKYSAYPGTNPGEAETANQFLKFVLETKTEGGQLLINENHDYEPLPKNLVKEAQAGAAMTSD